MRPSRKDVNMLLNRINPPGNHVSPAPAHLPCFTSIRIIFLIHNPFHSARRLSSIQTHSNVIRLSNASEAHPHLIHSEIAVEQIIIMFQPVATHT